MHTVEQVAAFLRSHDQYLLLTHIRPDGDTVGSNTALCQALRDLGKTAYLLENPEMTRSTAPYFASYIAPEGFVPETVVSCDIAALQLLPQNAKGYVDSIAVAIDHHPSFEGFGGMQLVRPSAAACAEIIYDVVAELTPLTAQIATLLYLGIATDTGCFLYGNTSAQTHAIAAKLFATGFDARSINKDFFQTKSRKRMQLEGAMLDTMTFHDQGRIVILSVPISLMERVEADEGDAEDLSALGPMIEGTDCAITMRELTANKWKLSVRSGKRINASTVCQTLGGGGHAAAAGCTIQGDLEEAKAIILDVIAGQA